MAVNTGRRQHRTEQFKGEMAGAVDGRLGVEQWH